MRRVAFKSLGCRVNFEEVECLRGRFVDEGWRAVPFDEEADLYVVNSCTVTSLADAESRKVVRRALRRRPEGGLVVVTGCYAQRDPEALRALEGVDLVLGNVEKAELFEHVARLGDDRRLAGDLWVQDAPVTRRFLTHGSRSGMHEQGSLRTRATLKIQDGCDEACTYCIIPSVRGVSVSRARDEVLTEARHLAICGFREIALTGVNTGCYGHDVGEPDGLAALVRELDAMAASLTNKADALGRSGGSIDRGADTNIKNAPSEASAWPDSGSDARGLRFRLNSLEPATVSDALLEAIAESPSFAQHFHVPLQHGDSRILRRMGRNYDADFYRATIERIAAAFPLAGIGADVMVGFPGEEDEHFAACCDFVRSLPLSYLHVFTYSPRSGTPATRMPGHVDTETKKLRSRELHAIEDELRTRFAKRLEGSEEIVLVESKLGPRGMPTGLSGSYLRVELDTATSPGGGSVAEHDFVRVVIRASEDPRLARAELQHNE